MKRIAFVAIVLLGLIVSCTPTATPQPQVALATATAQIPTVTPTQTPTTTLTPTPTRTPTSTPTLTPTPLPPLPALYIDGPYIKRSDTRQAVWLKGVNTATLWGDNVRTFNYMYNSSGLKKVVTEKWGINLVRVAIDPAFIDSLLPEIDKLISFADENGMYCILTPFPSDRKYDPSRVRGDDQLPVPDTLVEEVMGRLADHHKDKGNVLYGLWNEPHPEDIRGLWNDYNKAWQVWLDAGTKVAKAIRAKHPKSILVVPGGRYWARDLTYYRDHPFPFDNVIYDIHDYKSNIPEYKRELWTWAIGKYPVLIGEFGGACCPDRDPPVESDFDINYMRDVLQIANQNPGLVHYTMWYLGTWIGGVFDSKFNLTRRGKLLQEDLAKYPPARFR